ncbi:valine--tRNA ligase [Candidatus Woesearchaeota archaeon]|nr:valine--tRNA ligase [Candidatus Woesearchaeota archaeon]
MELPKKYSFKDIESKWKTYWKEKKIITFSKQGDNVYSADTPPPYVSGKMHMGHAISYSQGDFIMRFKRMKGFNVFFPFGTDDNGLPTERYIEKLKKLDSKKMAREDFVKVCSETVKEILPELVQPWIDLGISADFENAYSTIDDTSIKTSQLSFIDLHEKELVYRTSSPTVWCTKCQTAIAQAEFENIEKNSHFHDIAFHDEEGNELIIATTRPELIPACVGIFAHPEDKRYTHLKGKNAVVPILDYKVPIKFDESVALDKGTGLMMVCTFGDKEDVEKWHKYKLDLRVILDEKGMLNELAGPYKNLKILDARKQIVIDLEEKGFLKSSKQISHNTNVHERCGTEIEFLKTSQWFINVMDHKEKLIKAGDDINWYPTHMKTRYTHWVENLNWDWCISRQRHFGVPFPVWYEKDTGKPIIARKEDLPIYPMTHKPAWYAQETGKSNDNLIAEMDVMDTWATSSVSPQIALKWPDLSETEFKKVFPMTLRMQAHDIIRTWTFYTIVKGLYNNNTIPWKNIMVSGFVLDKHGKKMSKSKGNTIDPVKIIDLYGSDTVRYAASVVKLGEDQPFHDKYLETGKKFVTKIFNAAKFAHMHLEDYDGKALHVSKISSIDKWLVSKLNTTIHEADKALDTYEYAKARTIIERFFWDDLCDNYLEIVKDRLYKPELHGDDARYAGQMTLYHVLLNTLKLLAPYVPYITEEVFSWKFANDLNVKSIHTESWPTFSEELVFADEEAAGEVAKQIISFGRQEKNAAGVSQKHQFTSANYFGNKNLLELVKNDLDMTLSAGQIETSTITDSEEVKFEGTLAPKEEKKE